MNKNVIIAAYYFPPIGLAGTARPLAMANFFAGRGDKVHVLTVKNIRYPVYDQSALEEVDKRVNIIRVGSSDPARIGKILPIGMWARKLWRRMPAKFHETIFPDSKKGFVKPALAKLKQLLARNEENILITTSPPVSIHQLGLALAQQLDVKWIADWRDIWTSLPYFNQSENYRTRATAYTRKIIKHADLITATSPKTLDYFRNSIDSEADYYFLPNGYDNSDFQSPVPEQSSEIGIYGTINRLVGIEKVLEWLAELRNQNRGLDIRIKHTGYLDSDRFPATLRRLNLDAVFTSEGYQPHANGIRSIRGNRLNIISLSDQSDTSFIIPSKLFELLRAEPPLITLLPKGNAARCLLEQHQFESVYIVDNKDDFCSAVVNSLSESQQRSMRAGVEQFERRNQLEKLAAKLETL